MEPTNQGEAAKLSQVIQIDEGKIQEHLGEVVRSTVEETLNALLDAEAVRLCSDRKQNQLSPLFSLPAPNVCPPLNGQGRAIECG